MLNAYIYTEVASPVWGNAEQTEIICQVKFPLLGKTVPFNAQENDCMSHGAQLWAELKDGKYGDIGPYVAPIEEVTSTDVTSTDVAATSKRTKKTSATVSA